jgi:AraC-like DNA-binding protein
MAFNDSSLPTVSPEDAASLVATVAGSVLLPGDAGYDEERAVWNLNHELAPAMIVVPESVADVQAAIVFAARQQRPVLVKTTGHQIVGHAHGAVVIATRRMNGVEIDAVRRTARVGAGTVWSEVVERAAKAGLAPLNGSNLTVGVSGYTLGGGLSPTLGRSLGYAADHLRSLDVVTADGKRRHVDAESAPDLFWAMRGGKGNFGVVTALEFDLFPVPRLYGGAIYFTGERTADVLRAWAEWHPRTPETMVTSIAVMRMPPIPEVDELLRGKFLVAVRIAYNGTAADGERMIVPLRAVAPVVFDTVRDMPYTEVASIHNEPTEPVPYYERGIDPQVGFKESFRESTRLVVLNIPKSALRQRGLRIHVPNTCIRDPASPDVDVMREFVLHVASHAGKASDALLARLGNQCLDLMDVLINGHNDPASDSASAATALRAKQLIARHIGDPSLSVARIAAQLNMSASSLTRTLRAQGLSPMRYAWSLRLEHAARLLADAPRGSIGEVAFQCGFANAAHFSRAFKERFGMTPRDYAASRKAARSNAPD